MRLIDADALHDSINKETYRHTYIEQIHSIIDNATTIDAVDASYHAEALIRDYNKGYKQGKKDAVRHGEWKDIDGDGYYWECSVCGEVLCCNNNYCPNCGAMMD